MVGLADSVTITFTVIGAVVVLAAFFLVRVLLRREPTPARWRRYRLGIFVERDPTDKEEE